MLIPLTAVAIAAPVQIGVGDWIAQVVADEQPVKLAAMEALSETGTQVPLALGGIYVDGELRGAIEIPYGLSLLLHHDPDGEVKGLEIVTPELRPPVNIVHLSYNAMVGIGFALLALAAWLALAWWRRRDIPRTPWFLRPACGTPLHRLPGVPGAHGGDLVRAAADRGAAGGRARAAGDRTRFDQGSESGGEPDRPRTAGQQ